MLHLDDMNCVLWLDNWINGEERVKRCSSSGMLSRKWSCSACSVLIPVCFRDLWLEQHPQPSSKGTHHICFKHSMILRCSAQTNQRVFITYVHTANSKDLEKSICWEKSSSHLHMLAVSRIQLHQVIFESHCRHIFCFIDPEIISVLRF